MTGCYVGCTPPHLGTAEHIVPSAPIHVAIAHSVGQMPFTGADVLSLLVIGAVLITLGYFLRRRAA